MTQPLWRAAMVDPPWFETGGGRVKRGADRHYSLLKTDDIPGVIYGSGLWYPADHAHLYLWYTDNYLLDALSIVPELGFRYVRTIQWIKPRCGIGQYARGRHEGLLFCVRGKGKDPSVMTPRRDLESVIVAPHELDAQGRRIHSAKPKAAYEWAEARSYGPHYDFFARAARPGWTCWGETGLLL